MFLISMQINANIMVKAKLADLFLLEERFTKESEKALVLSKSIVKPLDLTEIIHSHMMTHTYAWTHRHTHMLITKNIFMQVHIFKSFKSVFCFNCCFLAYISAYENFKSKTSSWLIHRTCTSRKRITST